MSYHLFERFGVELEYMLVDRTGLDVRPVADEVLRAVAGEITSDVDVGALSWSNELVLHVIELKTNGPQASLAGLADAFQRSVQHINALAAGHGACLMPTAMHPWMDPLTQTRLWPHDYSPVYAAFDRIFNCCGHGWSNLQSAHLNLPFANDAEFGRLHAAARLVLPILPALAASSPLVDGRLTELADTRLEVYRSNARRIPSITGAVIPEPVFTRAAYEAQILEPIYADVAPFDPEGVLRYEWCNARGAIARFERNTIEIRVLDVQECPQADLAILTLVAATLRALCDERWTSHRQQSAWPVAPLAQVLLACIRDGDQAVIHDSDYVHAFGFDRDSATAGELWRHLFEAVFDPAQRGSADLAPLHVILEHGCLSRRIRTAVGANETRAHLHAVYRELCDCLAAGRVFVPPA
jgi:gamma-glutamyl:cysteine ligase YbdK (ATP-grasp superfamily)